MISYMLTQKVDQKVILFRHNNTLVTECPGLINVE